MFSNAEQSSAYFASNAAYIEELYTRYLQNPAAVDASWQDYFRSIAGDASAGKPGASWAEVAPKVIGAVDPETAAIQAAAKKAKSKDSGGTASEAQLQAYAHDAIRAMMMVRAYRVRGHLMSQLDPLGLEVKEPHPELDPAGYGFTAEDMNKEIFLNGLLGLEKARLSDILTILRETYCGHVAVEFMHIQFPDQKSWIQNRFEAARGQFK